MITYFDDCVIVRGSDTPQHGLYCFTLFHTDPDGHADLDGLREMILDCDPKAKVIAGGADIQDKQHYRIWKDNESCHFSTPLIPEMMVGTLMWAAMFRYNAVKVVMIEYHFRERRRQIPNRRRTD